MRFDVAATTVKARARVVVPNRNGRLFRVAQDCQREPIKAVGALTRVVTAMTGDDRPRKRDRVQVSHVLSLTSSPVS